MYRRDERGLVPSRRLLLLLAVLAGAALDLGLAQNTTMAAPTTAAPTTAAPTTEALTTEALTTEADPCSPSPCMNNGVCTPDGSEFTCDCTEGSGWYGATCSDGYCDAFNSTCENGGTCTSTYSSTFFTCACPDGYSGDTCGIDIEDCSSSLCQNGGTCVDGVNEYSCTCIPGYDGTNCDIEINECTQGPSPCENGAKCTDLINNYNCTCTPGYITYNCSQMCDEEFYGQDCGQNCTCVSGANCSHVDGDCSCNREFDGQTCDKAELNVTATSNVSDSTVSQDEAFTLYCRVNLPGDDLMSVTWYRNMMMLQTENNDGYMVQNDASVGEYNLTIIEAGATDTGTYYCEAVAMVTNSTIGNEIRRESNRLDINVLVIGKITVDSVFEAEAQLNETATLNCMAFSSETIRFRWERNGSVLNDMTKYAITEGVGQVMTGGNSSYTILKVADIVREDNGTYECVVLDAVGNETDWGDFQITVLEVVELTNPRYVHVEAPRLNLGWDFYYNGNSEISYCTANYSVSGSNETSMQNLTNLWLAFDSGFPTSGDITNLDPYTTYSVSLICVNEVGPSDYLHYPDQRTLQAAPEPPTNVIVSNIQQRSADVSWAAPEVTNGIIQGYRIFKRPDVNMELPVDVGSSARTATIMLDPGVTYRFDVHAYNREPALAPADLLLSDPETSNPFTTKPDFPGPPRNVRADDTEEACKIYWAEPSPLNGELLEYTVYKDTFRIGSAKRELSDQTSADKRTTKTFEKSELPFYSTFIFKVSATNDAGEGANSSEVICTKLAVNTPAQPAVIPTPPPANISDTSFWVQLPPYVDRDSPVSCYEVLVMQIGDQDVYETLDPNAYPPNQVWDYSGRAIGTPHVALVFNGNKYPKDAVTIGAGGSDSRTECRTGTRQSGGVSQRKKRETVEAKTINGVNGPLNDNSLYTLFVRVYSPVDENGVNVYYENGDFMTPIKLAKSVNPGAIAGGVIGGLIIPAFVIVLGFFVMKMRKRRDPSESQLVPGSDGVGNGHGHIPMGVVNPGIEVEEMVVKHIPLENLEKEIRRKAQEEKKIFWAEYKALPTKPAMVTSHASNHPANKDKNRYINIIAYDHTRVKLKTVDGIEGSDYINASYVNGYQAPDKFIASQGPKDSTVDDFWRMIWEQNCTTIVMLTKCVEDGKEKCAHYWTEPGKKTRKCGKLVVNMDSTKNTADYTIRSFFVHEAGNEDHQRNITQFHFTAWPDHGQPDYPNSMLCLIKRVRALTATTVDRGNVLVHCSAGVGRTGTYIVIDAMMDMMQHEKKVDIYNFIHEIRQQRNTLVQSFVQYFFIHMALLEHHLFRHTDVSAGELPKYYSQLNKPSEVDENLTSLELEFRRAAKLPVLKTEQKFANAEKNKEKNRIGHILPYDKNVVKLQRLLGVDFSDYINASNITGHQREGMYIATQGPLPNTISDFWRMIWESQTSTIVMLTEMMERGHEMCGQYWPVEPNEPMEQGDITITLIEEIEEGAFTIRELEIKHSQTENFYGNVDVGSPNADEGENEDAVYGNVSSPTTPTTPKSMTDARKVRQYHYRGWPEVGVPETGLDLVRLVNRTDEHQRSQPGEHPIVVHCSAGAGRTGVFLALSILMGRMEEENMVDVFQAVRGLRQQRPHMVQDVAQYKFCYSAICEYIESQSNEYQNFVPRN